MSSSPHPLLSILIRAAQGLFPDQDGQITVLPPPLGLAHAVVAFTAHHVIATSAEESWILDQLKDRGLLAPMSPRFLTALAGRLDRRDDGLDIVLAAPGLDGNSTLREVDPSEHPRVQRAFMHRENVRVFSDRDSFATVILGDGLAQRTELAIEIEPSHRRQGRARQTLVQARQLFGPDQAIFAQIAPGNAASIRAFSAAGFKPIASEVLYFAAT